MAGQKPGGSDNWVGVAVENVVFGLGPSVDVHQSGHRMRVVAGEFVAGVTGSR